MQICSVEGNVPTDFIAHESLNELWLLTISFVLLLFFYLCWKRQGQWTVSDAETQR